MEQKFIMTAFGKDRPGIAADIAEIIFEHQCNLEDSNMGRLADEFTLILLLSGKGEDLEKRLYMSCKHLEREKDIFVFIRPLDYEYPQKINGNPSVRILVEGIDQTGIVYKTCRLLASSDINIDTLSSRKKHIPNSGTVIYAMEISAGLPSAVNRETLEERLEELAGELNVEISVY